MSDIGGDLGNGTSGEQTLPDRGGVVRGRPEYATDRFFRRCSDRDMELTADQVLERVGFDKAVERGGVKKALATSKYDASDLLSKVIFYGLFLIVLQMAFGVFGTNPVSDLLKGVIAYLPKVIAAVLIIVCCHRHRSRRARTLVRQPWRSVLRQDVGRWSCNGHHRCRHLRSTQPAADCTGDCERFVLRHSHLFHGGGRGCSRWRRHQSDAEALEQVLSKYDEEKPTISQEMDSAKPRIEARATELKKNATDGT